MNRWAPVPATALLVVVVTILAFQPVARPTPRADQQVAQPTPRADGCPPEWHYANACSFIWINPERTTQP